MAKSGRKSVRRDPKIAEMVKGMAMLGYTREAMAKVFGMSAPVFSREYDADIKAGRIEADVEVISTLYENATKHNNFQAQQLWLKTSKAPRFKEEEKVEEKGGVIGNAMDLLKNLRNKNDSSDKTKE